MIIRQEKSREQSSLSAIGNEVDAACNTNGCRHSFRINLVAIAARRGMDYPCLAPDLLRIVYCRACKAAGRPARNLTFTQRIAGAHSRWPRSANI